MSSINQPSHDGSFWKGLRRRSVTPTRISRRSRYFSFSFLEPTIDEISQESLTNIKKEIEKKELKVRANSIIDVNEEENFTDINISVKNVNAPLSFLNMYNNSSSHGDNNSRKKKDKNIYYHAHLQITNNQVDCNNNLQQRQWHIYFSHTEYLKALLLKKSLGNTNNNIGGEEPVKGVGVIQKIIDVTERDATTSGTPTHVAAMYDRLRYRTWHFLKLITIYPASIMTTILTLQYIKTNNFVSILSDNMPNIPLFDYIDTSFPMFFKVLYILVVCSTILKYFIKLIPWPDKLVLSYHQQHVPQVKEFLNEICKDPNICKIEYFSEFLRLSKHSLKENMDNCLIEGKVQLQFHSIARNDKSSRARVECNCCRIRFDFGFQDKLHKRWAIFRKSGITFMRSSKDDSPTDILLFDSSFMYMPGDELFTGNSNSILLYGSNWTAEIILESRFEQKQWLEIISKHIQPKYSLSENSNPNGSFAPLRLKSDNLISLYAKSYRNGKLYFSALADALLSAKKEIFICGWFLTPTLLLKRHTGENGKHEDCYRLDEILRKVTSNGVQVYILLYHEFKRALANNSGYAMRTMRNISVNINVQRHRSRFSQNSAWSHHEKIVVVDQSIAFLGGLDLALMRYDDNQHRLTDLNNIQTWIGQDYTNVRVKDFAQVDREKKSLIDRRKVPRQPWRDVGCCLIGGPVHDLSRYFIERWQHARLLSGMKDFIALPQLCCPIKRELFLQDGLQEIDACQILRSVSRWSAGTKPESSIHSAYLNIIANAKEYIYIENQFFVSGTTDGDKEVGNRIAEAIVERILKAIEKQERFHVIVIMPLLPGIEGEIGKNKSNSMMSVLHAQYRTINRGEKSMYARIEEMLPKDKQVEDYIAFFGLRKFDKLNKHYVTEGIYVHSKAICVDGETVIIGSANINDRSMLGNRDSEIAVLIKSKNKKFGTEFVSSSLSEFLDCSIEEAKKLLSDTFKWNAILRKQAQKNTIIFRIVFGCLPCNSIKSWRDLEIKREEQQRNKNAEDLSINYNKDNYRIMPSIDDNSIKKKLSQIKGTIVEFPLRFLIEEKELVSSWSAEWQARTIFY